MADFSRHINIKLTKLILVLTLGFFSISSTAAVYTGITFTDQEKALHLSRIDALTTEASKCLNETYNEHVRFFRANKVSKYYGNRKYTKGWDYKVANGRRLTPIRQSLKDKGYDPNLEDQMENMSCVDFARKCLGQGFKNVGLSDQWQKIEQFNPDKIGNRMQHGLQALGWKLLYWNPDPSKNKAWDLDDQKIAPGNPSNVWGQNEARYETVLRSGTYLYNRVDDARSLVGFGADQPRFLETMNFGVGTANGGYHVFLVNKTNAIEAHSSRSLFSIDNLEFSPFNPLADGGGPRWTPSEKYRSGLVVVPPNTEL